MRSTALVTGLAWLWAAIVAAYLGWGWYAHAGLFRLLADWQVERIGSYYPVITFFLSWLVLAGPALAIAESRRVGDPAAMRPMGRGARAAALAAIGLVCVAVGAGAYLLSLRLPDMNGEPQLVDLATLGDRAPPLGHVMLTGAYDTDHAVSLTDVRKIGTTDTAYVPIVADKSDKAPASRRFFLEISAPRTNGAAVEFGFFGKPTGLLVADGLPGEIRQLFEKSGVHVEAPHYLLVSGRSSLEMPYYVVAGIGVPFGGIMLIFALAQLFARPREAAKRR